MTTQSSTSTNVSFDNGKYTKTTTTISSRKGANGVWVEESKVVVVEETDQPLFGPTVPAQPAPYPTFPPQPYPIPSRWARPVYPPGVYYSNDPTTSRTQNHGVDQPHL